MLTGNSNSQQERLAAARARFTAAAAELHAALVELHAAELEGSFRHPEEKRPKPWVRVSEAARQLGVSRSTIYRIGRAGKLRLVKHLGTICVPAEDLDRLGVIKG